MKHGTVLLVGLLVFGSACVYTPKTYFVYEAPNDLVLKGHWQEFLANNPSPKVVLRVPDAPKAITQTEMMWYDSFYSSVEKRLLEANFTVRDRSLLKEVLTRAGGELNYADIGRKIETDIILEIVNIKLGTWMKGTFVQGYYDASTKTYKIPEPAPAPAPTDVFGAFLEARVIMVSSGEVIGMATLKELKSQPWWVPNGSLYVYRPIKDYEINEADIEYLRTAIAQKLIAYLKGQAVSNSKVDHIY